MNLSRVTVTVTGVVGVTVAEGFTTNATARGLLTRGAQSMRCTNANATLGATPPSEKRSTSSSRTPRSGENQRTPTIGISPVRPRQIGQLNPAR